MRQTLVRYEAGLARLGSNRDKEDGQTWRAAKVVHRPFSQGHFPSINMYLKTNDTVSVCMHLYVGMYTHTDIYTHVHFTHIPVPTQIHVHTRSQACTHTHTHTYAHAHTHTVRHRSSTFLFVFITECWGT